MPSEVVSFRDRLKKRWKEQQDRKQKERIPKHISSGKDVVICKCPKCEVEHRLYMRWSGRGTPRVFCTACRAMLASIGETGFNQFGNLSAKSSRKITYHGYE
jgi:hypothetical protein